MKTCRMILPFFPRMNSGKLDLGLQLDLLAFSTYAYIDAFVIYAVNSMPSTSLLNWQLQEISPSGAGE